jgi:tyrosine-specific transport protein
MSKASPSAGLFFDKEEELVQKKMGPILLVAGTCIGSGMIALPMVLAKLGLIPSIILMLSIWFIMYYTSLINLELNLQAGEGLSLGALGRRLSGKTADYIGTISLKLLSYSLLAVFIYGGSSILQELFASYTDRHYSLDGIATNYALLAMIVLLFPITFIDHLNRLLFIGLLGVVAILITGLLITINWVNLPLFSEKYHQPSTWAALIPVVFTSFGFQVIFHTLTNYCHRNAKILKQAFFWGSLIPAFVYMIWTCSVLSVIHHANPLFYQQMIAGQAEVGELIQVLSHISQWQSIQLLVWWISILAIITSVLGVGVGLCDGIKEMLSRTISQPLLRNGLAAVITVLPAYLVVIYIPNAFIAALGFAGMILAVIAILLPTYLFSQIKTKSLYYDELRQNWLLRLSIVVGVIVIASELFNMLH